MLTNLTHHSPESSNFLVSRLIANMSRLSRIIQSTYKLSAGHILLFRMYDDNKPNKFKALTQKGHSLNAVDALYGRPLLHIELLLKMKYCYALFVYMCCCGYVFVMIKLWRFPQNALEKHFVSRKVE